MKLIEYHQGGELFEYNGRKFRVVQTCEFCDLKDECHDVESMTCSWEDRPDQCDVIYEEVDLRRRWMRNLLFILAVLLCSLFISTIVCLFLDSNYLLSDLLVLAGAFMIVDSLCNRYGRR